MPPHPDHIFPTPAYSSSFPLLPTSTSLYLHHCLYILPSNSLLDYFITSTTSPLPLLSSLPHIPLSYPLKLLHIAMGSTPQIHTDSLHISRIWPTFLSLLTLSLVSPYTFIISTSQTTASLHPAYSDIEPAYPCGLFFFIVYGPLYGLVCTFGLVGNSLAFAVLHGYRSGANVGTFLLKVSGLMSELYEAKTRAGCIYIYIYMC